MWCISNVVINALLVAAHRQVVLESGPCHSH
jgi:hypothetical protein